MPLFVDKRVFLKMDIGIVCVKSAHFLMEV